MSAGEGAEELKVASIGAGSSHSAVLISGQGSSQVVTFGRGEDGQLGHGDPEDQQTPLVVEELRGAHIGAVACGAEYTVAVSRNGSEVYSWGWGDFGRLGHGDCADVFIPRRIACLAENTVKSVTCGDTHTLAVLNDGRLFSFGRNQNGQLGNGTSDDCLEARMVSNLAAETVTGAACGAEHSVCVTASGKVYSWGWGRYGNLGVGSFVDELSPVQMKGLEGVNVQFVACGWRHSMAVDDKGRLWACGWSKYGQLGLGDFETQPVPAHVAALTEAVTRVDGGWRHTVAATASGVWAWGWNKFGQLGLGRTADVCTPTAVEALSGEGARMELVSCGWKHTLLVTEAGEFYAMGRGTNGQLGVPVPSDQFHPLKVEALCRGRFTTESFQHESTGNERMFVPACDRYALVPGGDATGLDASAVPDAHGSSPKRARVS